MATTIDLQGVNSKTIVIPANEEVKLENVDFIQVITNPQIRFSETDEFSDDNVGFILNFPDFYKSVTNTLYIKALEKDTISTIQAKGV